MTGSALNARYSDDKQSKASIEDQFRLCREHAGRERWQIVGFYEDAAISRASTILRPGIQPLMRDAQHGEINVLLAEALNRISRDQADVASLYKHLKFAGVTIVTLAEAVKETVRAYFEDTSRLNQQRRAQQDTDRRALAKIERAIAGIISAIEDGMYQPSMKARMDELERQKADLTVRLAEPPTDVPDVHPNVAANYSRKVARFAEALDDPDGGREAAGALRSLIGEIIVIPGEKRGDVHAELRGELMGILDVATAQPEQGRTGLMLPVATSPRNQIIKT